MLQVHERAQHLGAQQAVGTARVRLASALGHGLWLGLGPDQRQACKDRDAVDEVGVVLGKLSRIAIPLADMLVVRLRIR